jgi:hypothetical protein
MIIYTDNLIPARFAAVTIGTVILIRPKYKDDVGLAEHEKTHVRQFLDNITSYPFRYKFVRGWRLKYEAEAYAVQLQYSVDKTTDTNLFAKFLVDKYDLRITQEQALTAIEDAQKLLAQK